MTALETQPGPGSEAPADFGVRWRARLRDLVEGPGPTSRTQRLVMAVTLLACGVVRFATIGNPPLDRTAWKEIDYLTIAENLRNGTADPLYPSVSWPAPPQPRFTAMELPIAPYLTAGFEHLFGVHAWVARLCTLLAFLVVVVYVFLLARRELGAKIGLLAGVAAAGLPLLHPFGRMLLSEPIMLAAGLASLHHLGEWLEHGRRRSAVVGGAALSIALGAKIEDIWLLVPLAYLVWRSGRRTPREWLAPAAVVGASLIIPSLWYSWAIFHLETRGIHEFSIVHGHDKFQTITELTSSAWYRGMAAAILRDVLGGAAGALLGLIGAIAGVRMWRRFVFWLVYAGAVLAHMVVVAEGYLDAPYRLMVLYPVAAVLLATGAAALAAALGELLAPVRRTPVTASTATSAATMTVATMTVAAALLLLVPALHPRTVIGSSSPVDPVRWSYAQRIGAHLSGHDEIAVLGEYDVKKGGNDLSPVLFYYAGLRGWILEPQQCSASELRRLSDEGATLFAAVPTTGGDAVGCGTSPEDGLDSLRRGYPVLEDSDGLLLLDLRHPSTR